MNLNTLVQSINEALEEKAHPDHREGMISYMKNQFEFYGVKSPNRKEVLRNIWKEHRSFIQDNFRELTRHLWLCDHRECQYFAMDIIKKCKNQINGDDIAFLEHLITTKPWWDTVDFLSVHLGGQVFAKAPELITPKTDAYLAGDNIWLIRLAIIYQLSYGPQTDKDRLFDILVRSMGTKEFFINKAIGWALRQYSKYNPNAVREFIETHKTEMANLSIREGSKYI
ncbi:MAG: DNA alkylation repair protein [Saprospiraceae bacterium]|nr:DNA alkylation repair protein [Saprospiraceae bacterium]